MNVMNRRLISSLVQLAVLLPMFLLSSFQAHGETYLDGNVIVVRQDGVFTPYLAMTDNLGSYLTVVDSLGNKVFDAHYDAWGRQHDVTVNSIKLHRGYCGHEMLDEFRLINMNARLYSPYAGRFLAPDNYVQAPENTQSFNRYSYCLNNPLKYADPSGEIFHLVVGALIGGMTNWMIHDCQWNAKGLGYFGVGAAAGFLSAGVGAGVCSSLPVAGSTAGGFSAGFWGTSSATIATSSFVSGAAIGGAAGFSGGFITGFGNSLVDGNSFFKSLYNGGVDGLMDGATAGLIGGLASGIEASLDGRRFWDGATLISENKIVDLNMPHVNSRGKYNCVYASLESVDKSYGGDITQETMRAALGGDSEKDPAEIAKALKYYATLTNGKTGVLTKNDLEKMESLMSKQIRFLLDLESKVGDVGHMVVMNSIVERNYRSISGREFYKRIYYVMNPARKSLQSISVSTIQSSNIIFYYR